MAKKTMVLADRDRLYLERLSNYFMEKSPMLDLCLFTDEPLLRQYLRENKPDILVMDESFLENGEMEEARASVKLLLSVSMKPKEGFGLVKKYQKTETLLNEILLRYAEATGSAETIRGNSRTKLLAFYSPAGGTGKTTLSLGMATVCAKVGFRTLYLNMEEIDSVNGALARTPGSLSDVFLALKTKGMNPGIRLASCVGQEAHAGFSYVSGVESISEQEEITREELKQLLEAIKSQSEYDVVILDLSSAFTEKNLQLLELAETVYTPVTPGEHGAAKLSRFLQESSLHDRYDGLFRKMVLILNRMEKREAEQFLAENPSLSGLRVGMSVPALGVLSQKSRVLRAGEQLLPVYQPVISGFQEENQPG